MLKKTRLYLAISLLVQSVTLVFLFLALWIRKKSVSRALLAVAAAEGAAGLFLFWLHLRDPQTELYSSGNSLDDYDFFDDDEFDFDESYLTSELRKSDEENEPQIADIPRDEDATEADFQ